ncbi:MAG: hypothetical protein ABJC19_05730 [Gemmatimonadota bacterium]
MMRHWGRFVVAAVMAEAVPLAIMAGLVAALAAGDPFGDPGVSPRILRWVEALLAGGAALLAALWVTRPLTTNRIGYGVALGVVVILLDIGLLVANGTAFNWMQVASNFGRLESAVFGSWLAGRRFRARAAIPLG